MPFKLKKPFCIDDTELYTWFERDRAHIELRKKSNGETILEFWDEQVAEAVEDGFLNPKDYHGSIYDYAHDLGLLTKKAVKAYK